MKDQSKDSSFVRSLVFEWYQSGAYGDQVPKDLGTLMHQFTGRHGMLNEEGMWELIMESGTGDPWSELFECIFTEGAAYALQTLANAVDSADNETLREIDLMLIGVSNIKADGSSCPHEHIMHPVHGGPKLFLQLTGSPFEKREPAPAPR